MKTSNPCPLPHYGINWETGAREWRADLRNCGSAGGEPLPSLCPTGVRGMSQGLDWGIWHVHRTKSFLWNRNFHAFVLRPSISPWTCSAGTERRYLPRCILAISATDIDWRCSLPWLWYDDVMLLVPFSGSVPVASDTPVWN